MLQVDWSLTIRAECFGVAGCLDRICENCWGKRGLVGFWRLWICLKILRFVYIVQFGFGWVDANTTRLTSSLAFSASCSFECSGQPKHGYGSVVSVSSDQGIIMLDCKMLKHSSNPENSQNQCKIFVKFANFIQNQPNPYKFREDPYKNFANCG